MLNPSLKDSQREVLQRLITLFKNAALDEDEVTDYIQAFSAYLSKKDNAYYYNYSFLVQQNCGFKDFLKKTVAKETVLKDFFKRLKRLPQLKPMLGRVGSVDPIEVSMNNFWKIDTQSEACSLVEDFSIGGAVCGESGDIIMLRCGDSTFSFSPAVDDKYLEQIAEMLRNAAAGRGDHDE